MSWFLLTSANLSKAAWGRKLKSKDESNYIMAQEAGVLFLPKFLVVIYFLIFEMFYSSKYYVSYFCRLEQIHFV
jgi:hypothetical protein